MVKWVNHCLISILFYMRPLSPHLQVYKPELTSILSILHRITGVGFMIGTYIVLWWLHIHAVKNSNFECFVWFFSTFIGKLFSLGIIFSCVYHFCNGIRYLFWAIGFGFELRHVYASGYAVVLLSLLLTVYIWVSL